MICAMRITVLAGGVGAARFLDGLVRVVDPAEVTVISNVSDDFAWHGLFVCPDIDTVVYTLAGLEGDQGWGIRGDTRAALDELTALGEDPWFLVGDRDLATHVWRTERLRTGHPLSEVTRQLAAARGLASTLLPVTDDPHPTVVLTEDAPLGFQDYFVRRRAADAVRGFRFPGAHAAKPAPGVLDAIATAEVVVFAPSNPFVSIAPILEVPGIREALASSTARRVAVTPIVGGAAVKGPAASMLASLGHEVSALAVARLYARLVDTFVLDAADAAQAPAIEALGLRACVTDTMMSSEERRTALARAVLDAAAS